MYPSKIAFPIAVCALSLVALCRSAPAAAQQPRDCTLTMNMVPDAAQSDGPPSAEPIIFVDTTQSYPIKSFTVKTAAKRHAPGVATVTADLALESTMATLLDRHAVIGRAALVCPSRNATLTNAVIGYIGTLETAPGETSPTLSFTMNFWSDNLDR
jgi:hypothetical protein